MEKTHSEFTDCCIVQIVEEIWHHKPVSIQTFRKFKGRFREKLAKENTNAAIIQILGARR